MSTSQIGDTSGGQEWLDEATVQRLSDFTPAARAVLHMSGELAGAAPGARHVASVLFNEHPLGPRVAGATCCTDLAILRREVRHHASLSPQAAREAGLNDDTAAFCELASSQGAGQSVGVDDLLTALFEPVLGLESVLALSGLSLDDVRRVLPRAMRAVEIYGQQKLKLAEDLEARSSPVTLVDGGSSSSTTPAGEASQEELSEVAELSPRTARRAATQGRTALAACGIDLVAEASAGRLDPVLGREAEVTRVLQILSRRTKCNCCLVGAPGVGKTAIVEAVAQRIAEGNVPPQLRECREVWALDVGAMLAGTGLRGDFEERLKALLTEARSASRQLVLFVDELHLLVGAGRSEGNTIDAANLLKPVLARGDVRCIGATTSDEYERLILKGDAAFERRFQVVEVPEPSASAAREMLAGLAPRYTEHHGLRAGNGVVEAAVDMSIRGIKGRFLPDKAIDVLDEACSLAAERGADEVRVGHVREVVQRMGSALGSNTQGAGVLSWFSRQWSRL